MLSILISPVKLLPSIESSTSLSKLEIAGETEPYKSILDKFIDITRPWEHLIPNQEQTELGFEVSQELNAWFEKSKPCFRLTKAWKSEEEEKEVPKRVKNVTIWMSGNIFSWKFFIESEFGRTWRRNKGSYYEALRQWIFWKRKEKLRESEKLQV